MLIKPSKFLMNEADASPGGGAVVLPPVEPPAQAASAPASGVTIDQVKSLFGELRTEIRNGVLADLRKTGDLKQVKAAAAEPPAQTAATPAAGISLSDVKAMLERDRVVTTRAVKYGLTEAQTQRMRAALESVQAGDSYAAEADAYLSDMGLAKAQTPAAPAAATIATPTPEAPKPASAPSAPSGHGLPTQNGIVDLFSLTDQQRKDMGPAGIRKVMEELAQIGNAQAGIPQRPRPPSQR